MLNFNTHPIFIQSDFPEGFWSSGINVSLMSASDGRDSFGNQRRYFWGYCTATVNSKVLLKPPRFEGAFVSVIRSNGRRLPFSS